MALAASPPPGEASAYRLFAITALGNTFPIEPGIADDDVSAVLAGFLDGMVIDYDTDPVLLWETQHDWGYEPLQRETDLREKFGGEQAELAILREAGSGAGPPLVNHSVPMHGERYEVGGDGTGPPYDRVYTKQRNFLYPVTGGQWLNTSSYVGPGNPPAAVLNAACDWWSTCKPYEKANYSPFGSVRVWAVGYGGISAVGIVGQAVYDGPFHGGNPFTLQGSFQTVAPGHDDKASLHVVCSKYTLDLNKTRDLAAVRNYLADNTNDTVIKRLLVLNGSHGDGTDYFAVRLDRLNERDCPSVHTNPANAGLPFVITDSPSGAVTHYTLTDVVGNTNDFKGYFNVFFERGLFHDDATHYPWTVTHNGTVVSAGIAARTYAAHNHSLTQIQQEVNTRFHTLNSMGPVHQWLGDPVYPNHHLVQAYTAALPFNPLDHDCAVHSAMDPASCVSGTYPTVILDGINNMHLVSTGSSAGESMIDVRSYVKLPVVRDVRIGPITVDDVDPDAAAGAPPKDSIRLHRLEGTYAAGDRLLVPVIPGYDSIGMRINGIDADLRYGDIINAFPVRLGGDVESARSWFAGGQLGTVTDRVSVSKYMVVPADGEIGVAYKAKFTEARIRVENMMDCSPYNSPNSTRCSPQLNGTDSITATVSLAARVNGEPAAEWPVRVSGWGCGTTGSPVSSNKTLLLPDTRSYTVRQACAPNHNMGDTHFIRAAAGDMVEFRLTANMTGTQQAWWDAHPWAADGCAKCIRGAAVDTRIALEDVMITTAARAGR